MLTLCSTVVLYIELKSIRFDRLSAEGTAGLSSGEEISKNLKLQ